MTKKKHSLKATDITDKSEFDAPKASYLLAGNTSESDKKLKNDPAVMAFSNVPKRNELEIIEITPPFIRSKQQTS